MRIQLNRVSASESGDYYQVTFEGEVNEEEGPYVLVQRQFEFPDGGRCYVETHDQEAGRAPGVSQTGSEAEPEAANSSYAMS